MNDVLQYVASYYNVVRHIYLPFALNLYKEVL